MFAAERISLQGRLGVYATGASLAVQWEDTEFTPVKGNSWLAPMLVGNAGASYSTIGLTRWIRKHCIFQVNINTPDNQGSKPGELIAEAINAIFVGQIQDPGSPMLTFYPATLKSAGSRNGFSTTVLSIPYQVDFQEGVNGGGFVYVPLSGGSGVLHPFAEVPQPTSNPLVFTMTVVPIFVQLTAFGMVITPPVATVSGNTITFTSPPSGGLYTQGFF